MKLIFTYQLFLKSIVFVMLCSQIWVNTVSHCSWMMDSELELFEFFGSEDSDSEKEENKKEKDDKIRMDFFVPKFALSIAIAKIFQFEEFQSLSQPDILTPPPELSFFMS